MGDMQLKTGVKLVGIKPELVLGLYIADSVYRKYQTELVITSVVDGVHKRKSLHYSGYAADLRIWGFSADLLREVAIEIQKALGEDYDVVVESNHIHLEYEPKNSIEKGLST